MAQPYVPPGVTITEAVAPQVVPLIASASDVVLVGVALGHQKRTDQVRLTEAEGIGVPVKLPFLASIPGSKLESVLSVISATNPSEGENEGKGFKETAYEVDSEEGTINLVAGKGIKPNTLINVTYTYVSADYYNPIRLFNFNEVQNRYGQALATNEDGEFLSPLSLAAQKAFESGASSVITQPLFHTSDGTIVYNSGGFITNAEFPTAKQVSEASTWETTLQALNLVEGIDIIVPVVGQGEAEGKVKDGSITAIFKAVLGYEQQRNAEEQFIFGCFGEDSTGEEGLDATLHAHGTELRAYANGDLASQNLLLNVGNFSVSLPEGGEKNVGGQFAAAAVAGALASRPVASSLTRKGLNGFTKINDLRTPSQKNEDAGEGLFVVEQIPGGTIRCRHAITLDNTHGASRSEISVVRAKFTMVESIRQTLENQIIGQIIADGNSPIIVRSAIVGVLSALQSAGSLVGYKTPVVAIASLEPTTITASFSYRPAFTLNYIDIVFALDLSSQTVTLVEAN